MWARTSDDPRLAFSGEILFSPPGSIHFQRAAQRKEGPQHRNDREQACGQHPQLRLFDGSADGTEFLRNFGFEVTEAGAEGAEFLGDVELE